MNRLASILFWSIISAAFIGPGTVTTAASAGASYGTALIWALTFSTIATLVLQEAAARLTIASGKTLGAAIREQFPAGFTGALVVVVAGGAVIIGCAAYEAGNILGGVAGASLAFGLDRALLTVVSGLLAGVLLWFGSTRLIAYVLGAVVAMMGAAFVVTAIAVLPPWRDLITGTLVPSFPSGAGLLIIGMVGTTVVPYNLFLGSGIARGRSLPEMRFGLTIATLLGGAISIAVLVVGGHAGSPFSFQTLAEVLASQLGPWAALLFGFGLFAAGFSSAITAPLAAALTAQSLFGRGGAGWNERGIRFRSVWLGVLLVGVIFGLTGIRPVPAIIAAQALNGLLLPFVAVFLLLVVNAPRVIGDTHLNGRFANALMAAVVLITILLGARNVLAAGATLFGFSPPGEAMLLTLSALSSAAIAWPVARRLAAQRRNA